MSDIVKRLRQTWWSDDYGVSKDDLCDARNEEAANAADEIERLRKENATLTAERDALFVLTDRLTAEHDALRAERDEARREVCNMKDFHGLPRDYALERGWNCFKENTDD